MGYGPGVALYTVFGAMAWYSGVLLWQQFTGLDSTRYPMRNVRIPMGRTLGDV